MPRELPPALCKGPFTATEAAALGVGRGTLRHRRFRRIFRHVYVLAELPDSREQRFAAARLVIPEHGIVCGLTAAWLHGADVRRQDDRDVHVGFAKGRRIRERPGLKVCQETLDPADVVILDGVALTSPLRTVFDCLRWLRDPEGVVVADALTRYGQTTVAELRNYFAAKRRLRNLRRGEVLLDDIEPNSASPQETRLRIALVRFGVGRPAVPIYVFRGSRDLIGKLDMGYEELKLGIEYDGALHWEQRLEDDRRRRRLRNAGWEILVFGKGDLRDPAAVAAEVMTAKHRRRRELGPV